MATRQTPILASRVTASVKSHVALLSSARNQLKAIDNATAYFTIATTCRISYGMCYKCNAEGVPTTAALPAWELLLTGFSTCAKSHTETAGCCRKRRTNGRISRGAGYAGGDVRP